MTTHNQWLHKTRSIPYWTTNVFSSTVKNDERRIYELVLGSPFYCDCLERHLSDEYSRSSLLILASAYPWKLFVSCGFICILFVVVKTCLPDRWLAMGFRCGSTVPAGMPHITIL
jgi:hypothetical protein